MTCPKCGSPHLTILSTEWDSHKPVKVFERAGKQHRHDPKTFQRTYRCERGHEFTRSGRVPCPQGDWPKKEKK